MIKLRTFLSNWEHCLPENLRGVPPPLNPSGGATAPLAFPPVTAFAHSEFVFIWWKEKKNPLVQSLLYILCLFLKTGFSYLANVFTQNSLLVKYSSLATHTTIFENTRYMS